LYIGRAGREEIFEEFASFVSYGKVEIYRGLGFDFVPGRREGCYIWDIEGRKRLLNCRSSGGVFNLGHRHPVTTEALRSALNELDCGDHLLISEQRAALAKRLAGLLPGDLTYTVFSVSGGEAIDLAIKLARGHTGRAGVISVSGGYHGTTGLATAAGDPKWKDKFGPMTPGFSQVPFGDLEALEPAVGEDTAAVLLETYPATGGVQVPPDGYFQGLREICDRTGALWIDDEVQTGLGRTGTLWAVDEYGLTPDIMVLGKGMSGGIYPLSATCISERLELFFRDDPFIHISTGGGTELGCVVTMAMLDVITAPGFLEHVRAMGELLEEGLVQLGERHPDVQAGFRRKGLMAGVDMVEEPMGLLLTMELYKNGVLALFADNNPRTMIIMPPLVAGEMEIGEVLEALERSYDGVRKSWNKAKAAMEGQEADGPDV